MNRRSLLISLGLLAPITALAACYNKMEAGEPRETVPPEYKGEEPRYHYVNQDYNPCLDMLPPHHTNCRNVQIHWINGDKVV